MPMQTGTHLADALHIQYAINGDVDIIVTNDRNFRKAAQTAIVSDFLRKHHIEIMDSEELMDETDARWGKEWRRAD